ncbi:DUF6132 family protein [Porcincola intestinalis]|uniref:DUF6132 family protein n=1 Tax=Porcincola intestinalis TaxID=2606632 RepID=UPI0038CD5571
MGADFCTSGTNRIKSLWFRGAVFGTSVSLLFCLRGSRFGTSGLLFRHEAFHIQDVRQAMSAPFLL